MSGSSIFLIHMRPLLKVILFLSLGLLFAEGNTIQAQNIGPDDKVISIFFGGGSYYIDGGEARKLEEFVFEIEQLYLYEVEVHGHTDNIGSIEYNQYLSEMRSQGVIQYLQSLDIDFDSIKKVDFGELNPAFDNNTWRGQLSNRRVDIVFRRILI